jgi:hypothetical protein
VLSLLQQQLGLPGAHTTEPTAPAAGDASPTFPATIAI